MMFLHPRHNPPSWYHALYLALSVAFGVLMSFLLHVLLEMLYLNAAESSGRLGDIVWTTHFTFGSCALPPLLQYALIVLGMVGGLLLGRVWWRWIYVEHRWQQKTDPKPRR